jgi:hypothetical protein
MDWMTMVNQLLQPQKPIYQVPYGLVKPGNIDLASRPVVRNPDGTISTVRSASFGIGGKETLLPTIAESGARILSNKEAVDQYKRTGQHLGVFESPEAATSYANMLHFLQERMYK